MTTQTPTQFARRVRAELNRQDLTVRGLARKIDPTQVERARRNLHRWLDDGIAPHPNSRAEVARALGLDENALDDDDEESDEMIPVLMSGTLLRRFVREEIAAASQRVTA